MGSVHVRGSCCAWEPWEAAGDLPVTWGFAPPAESQGSWDQVGGCVWSLLNWLQKLEKKYNLATLAGRQAWQQEVAKATLQMSRAGYK